MAFLENQNTDQCVTLKHQKVEIQLTVDISNTDISKYCLRSLNIV